MRGAGVRVARTRRATGNRRGVPVRVALVVTALVLGWLAVTGGYLADIPEDYCPDDPEAFRSVELLPPGCRP